MDMGPGLYIHVPFCEKRCHYCDFNTYLLRDGGVEQYLTALEQEIALYQMGLPPGGNAPGAGPAVATQSFAAVFIGGGTPTALTAAQLDRLLAAVRDGFALADDVEITVEANPGTLTNRRLEALREGGVNRLSLGVQSLNDGLLKALGRIHTARQAQDCYERARRVGFNNVSLDLVFGLPGQHPTDWQRTLTEVTAWGPDHLSCYGLIIEPGTPFGQWHGRGLLDLPGEEAELTMYRFAQEHLAERGYDYYEISNWAKAGRQSRHNRLYWQQGQWLGLGPGAHSQWGRRRFANVRLPETYATMVARGQWPVALESMQTLSDDELMEDVLIFGLRLREGVSASDFQTRFGRSVDEEFGPQIKPMIHAGLLEWSEGPASPISSAHPVATSVSGMSPARRLRLTPKGLLLANQVMQRLLRG